MSVAGLVAGLIGTALAVKAGGGTTLRFDPFEWKSEPPVGIPFEKSQELIGLKFSGSCASYRVADTWFPSWADDGNLYSPWTDGLVKGLFSNSSMLDWEYYPDGYNDWMGFVEPKSRDSVVLRKATTGNAVLKGDDPLNLQIENTSGLSAANPFPYGGRYPCASLVYNGIWYYGTYCLSPYGETKYGDTTYNWPQLGPFVGFRTSTDHGKTWKDCPHPATKPIFGENGLCGYPVKIGSPHFVDFGKNMQHSPDGNAYLVAHGSDFKFYPPKRFEHLSWITGDQIYLIRVKPSLQTINDASAYEFFAGFANDGNAVWTKNFSEIQPMLEWEGKMGCVTMTYDFPLKKYLMVITDGVKTCAQMNTYLMESDHVTGPWKLVTYMRNFGEQAYFVNFPSKFISADGKKLWMCYAGNFAPSWNGITIKVNPPGSQSGLVLQAVELLTP